MKSSFIRILKWVYFHSTRFGSGVTTWLELLSEYLQARKSIRVCQRLSSQPKAWQHVRAWRGRRASELRWAGIRSHRQPSWRCKLLLPIRRSKIREKRFRLLRACRRSASALPLPWWRYHFRSRSCTKPAEKRNQSSRSGKCGYWSDVGVDSDIPEGVFAGLVRKLSRSEDGDGLFVLDFEVLSGGNSHEESDQKHLH